MAALEREGYLTHPHTSAGRIPTDKGYRFFVDHLGNPQPLARAEHEQVQVFFSKAHGELERVLQDTSRLLAQLTDCAGGRREPRPRGARRPLGPDRAPLAPHRHGRGGALERRRGKAHDRLRRGRPRHRARRRERRLATAPLG